jgi:hypothetical protein
MLAYTIPAIVYTANHFSKVRRLRLCTHANTSQIEIQVAAVWLGQQSIVFLENHSEKKLSSAGLRAARERLSQMRVKNHPEKFASEIFAL